MEIAAPLRVIHHIAVNVSDLERSEKFYTQAFHFPIVKRHHHNDGTPRSLWLQCGEIILMLEKTSEKITPSILVAFTIKKEDRENWRRHLKTLHIPIIGETEFTLYFPDPDGHRLALSHYSE